MNITMPMVVEFDPGISRAAVSDITTSNYTTATFAWLVTVLVYG